MATFDSSVLMTLLVTPFIGAAILLFIPGKRLTPAKIVSTVTALITLALSVYVFLNYDYHAGGYQFTQEYKWLGSLGVTLKLGVDGISVPMLLLTGIVITTGCLISWTVNNRTKDFFILLLLLVAGVYGTFSVLDLFFLFFFYELAVLPMYLLIGVWGSSTDFKTFLRTKEYGAMKLTLYLVAGSVLVWIALMAIYAKANLGTFDITQLQNVQFSENFQRLFFPFLLIGFGTLAGLWPFHTWSPDGHVAAPTAVSMLHAGVLMKLGAYGIIRVGMTLFPQGAQDWMPILLIFATINVIYGASSALAQRDLKYVVGYSSVSHMGYVLLGIATLNQLGVSGAVLQMFSHGIMTALFFAVVGVIYERSHTRDISILEGLSKRMGVVAAFFAVAGLASLGLPGLSGFIAELLVFLGAFQTGVVPSPLPLLVGILAVSGAAVTAVYILRLMAKVFFGPISEKWVHLKDANRLEGLAAAILVGFLLLVGLVPFPFLRIIDSGVQTLLKGMSGG